VMEYLNVSLEEGFRRWIECSDGMKEALLSGDTTTSVDLINFFKAFDIEVEKRSGIDPLITAINTRQPIVALVVINGEGNVSPVGDTAHWIRITEVKKDIFVRYYNPFTNKNEETDWTTFMNSWDKISETSGNEEVDRRLITT